jgi:hypothetical protein
VTQPRRYSVGTVIAPESDQRIELIGKALQSLLADQHPIAGTWGGPDGLDEFICTCHATMALLAGGFSPNSREVTPAIRYLETIDPEVQLAFFWRAAVFLNIPEMGHLVDGDAAYLWKNRRRIGVHKDYPAPFFLLKLIRFAQVPPPTPALENVIDWILEEWDSEQCWYGRTSITSMALALLVTEKFDRRREILETSIRFLLRKFDADLSQFSVNTVDDCYTVFNLCERKAELDTNLGGPELDGIWKAIASVAMRIADESTDGIWSAPPPFGGSVTSFAFPTAVAVRALMAYEHAFHGDPSLRIAARLLADPAESFRRYKDMAPFWGIPRPRSGSTKMCFVLMPFEQQIDQFYKEYVKKPLEGAGLIVRRADDISKSSLIMDDIWQSIVAANVIVADLTKRNANVFYELGLAHSRRKDVILIAKDIEDVPFDLSSVRILLYGDSPDEWGMFESHLIAYCKELGVCAP